jgi:hypothetical protein
MNGVTVFLVLEALVALSIVMGVHALRRRTSLVYSYMVLAFMRFASWATSPAPLISIGPFTLSVGSNVFFSADSCSTSRTASAPGGWPSAWWWGPACCTRGAR